MSSDLFYFYIYPSLCRRDMILAYADKNNYSKILPGFRQPETVVKNRNGVFFDPDEKVITREEAVERCVSQKSPCIIKPTLDSGCGKNVNLLDGGGRECVMKQFGAYGADFIVQKKMRQHAVLDQLNESSLNTMRIVSYRALDGRIYTLKDKTFIRVGNKGSVRDNIGSGGGMCQVFDDGFMNDNVVRYHTMKKESAKFLWGVENVRIPSFDKALQFVKILHEQLPYFDLVGWDVGIDVKGDPFFVEYNLPPEVCVTQQGCGPFFGDFIDEIMERIACVRKFNVGCSVNLFKRDYDFYVQTSGNEYITRTIN